MYAIKVVLSFIQRDSCSEHWRKLIVGETMTITQSSASRHADNLFNAIADCVTVIHGDSTFIT